MAASTDEATLYCIVSKVVWAVSTKDAQAAPKQVRAGDGVAVDPRNGDLVIQIFAADGTTRFVRLRSTGNTEEEISISHPTFITYPIPLSPNAIAPDGRILVHGGGIDTWNFRVGIIDPVKKLLQIVQLYFNGDPAVPGWTSDGRIMSVGLQYRMNLWRFRRIAAR